jgi:putative MATE family efflux protein
LKRKGFIRRWIENNKAMAMTVVALAWPTIVEQALQTIVQYADAAMVGQIGKQASAAVGLTSTMGWLVNAPMFAMGIGVLAFISRSLGAKDQESARTASVQAFFLAGLLGLGLGAITLLISPFLPGWLGAEQEIRREASIYFAIICAPMLFRSFSIMFGSVLRAASDMKTPMVVGLITNGINVVLNFFLIYESRTLQIGSMSLPMWGAGLGVTGAAIATAIAHCVGGVLMLMGVLRNPLVSFKRKDLKWNRPVMNQCVKVGFPVALERMCACLGQVVFTSLVTSLGTVALAAHSLAITAEQAFYIPGYGMQAAAATLAGNALGEGDEKKLNHMAHTMMGLTVFIMAVTGGLLFAFPQFMMGIFSSDAAVIEMGASALRIVAVSEPLFGLLIILEGVFNGVGDTRVPFIYSLITMWGVRILGTFLCVSVFHMGLNQVWLCMVGDNVMRALLLGERFVSGRWKKQIHFQQKAA